ncbi:MAG: DUF535 family protein [Acidobacteriota bacterium]|nr:DUF535 family protein [Acidobacteriota bacterium]
MNLAWKLRARLSPQSARKLGRVSISIPRLLEIFQILKLPALHGIAATYRELPFKYLADDYLARDLSVDQRAACFLHHYKYLAAKFPADLLRRTLYGDVAMLDINESGNAYAVTMGLPKPSDCEFEGELSLYLRVNGAPVFNLSCTVVPGWIVESSAPDVLFITRLQGIEGCLQPISLATRTLCEVAPPALLFAALEGIARACGIHEMAGICATRHVSYNKDCANSLNEAYDDFFTAIGAARSSTGFFCSPLPAPQKPLATIKQGHKIRTRKKRAFKQQLADDVCRLLRESR